MLKVDSQPGGARRVAACILFVLSLGLMAGPGCASYTEELREAQLSIVSGNTEFALRSINERLGVDTIHDIPDDLDNNATLLLLERATLLQSIGSFELAARDMMIVDQRLDWLDLTSTNAGELARYMYSDDATKYRAPAYERLLLNTLNMINFLARYDLEGARVEARRFTIMESFYIDEQGRALMPGLLALGNYLAGASFEASRDYDEAARYYTRAWHFGLKDEDLRVRLRDLYRVSGYSGKEIEDRSLDAIRKSAQEDGPLTFDAYFERHRRGDTLIIAQFGLVPYKKAIRVSGNRAMTIANGTRYNSMSGATRTQVNTMILSGALTHVNFPELSSDGLPHRTSTSAKISVDGRPLTLYQGMDVTRSVQTAWLDIAGTLMVAALTRAITRATIGAGGRAVGEAAIQSNDDKAAAAGVLGWLVATGAEVALEAADTPDTRSWTTLPAQIRISRTQLSHGLHSAQISLGANYDKQTVPIWEDRLNIINFSRIR